jgi:Fe-S cluster biosynthesis and repair protein YggX
MSNFNDISKDYFKKNKEERLELINEIYLDIEQNIINKELSRETLVKLMDSFLKDAEEKEHYETASVIKEIKILLEK